MDQETSPKTWQKPNSRIKLKVKKRKTSKSTCPSDILVKAAIVNQDGGCSTKRSNPFGCSSAPKRRPSTATSNSDNKLFKALDGQVDELTYSKDVKCYDSGEILPEEPKSHAPEQPTDDNNIDIQQQCDIFPIDWSLKTKVRFTSSMSFSWASSLKSVELADSVTRFVRCDDNGGTCSPSMLNSACNVWMHPSIPSMQLFPRFSTIKQYDEETVIALQRDWVASFHSLFNLLRCGHCAYFYLCTNQCTMLFLASSRDTGMTAVITPSTKGLRDALDREGIEFTLPHDKPQDKSSTSDDDEDDHDDKENQSDNDEWMESIGLNKDQFPSLDKCTKQQTIEIRNKDQHPSSTVMVTGGDTLALSNFILNWKSFTTGIPPTLVAPVAFEGATLRSHKISQGIVKHQQDKDMKQLYSLEVTGAILPGCLQRICQLITMVHNGPFTATLTPYQCTVPLNVPGNHDMSGLDRSGMTTSELEYFTQTNPQLEKTCLKEIKYSNDGGLYTWK